MKQLQVISRNVKVRETKLSDGSFIYDVLIDDVPGGWDKPNIITLACHDKNNADMLAYALITAINEFSMEKA